MIRKAAKTDMVSVAEMAVMMWDGHSVEELKGEFEQEIENGKKDIMETAG